jgi:hypothetical protein
MADFVTRIIL